MSKRVEPNTEGIRLKQLQPWKCLCPEICGRKLTPWIEERSHKASPGVAWVLKTHGPGWAGEAGHWSTVSRKIPPPALGEIRVVQAEVGSRDE